MACFCHRHSPQTRKNKLLAKAKTVAEVTAALGGILGLLEQLVEVWQSLPFGPSPAMPEDYEYLRAASGSRGWSDLPDRYVPSNRGGDSVDWRSARTIYDDATLVLLEPRASRGDQVRALSLLNQHLECLIDSLPEEIRRSFLKSLDGAGEARA